MRVLADRITCAGACRNGLRTLLLGAAALAVVGIGFHAAAQTAPQSGNGATQPANRAPRSVLRTHPTKPYHAARIAQIQHKYAQRADVRIAKDADKDQLLVLAPEHIHHEVHQALAAVNFVAGGSTTGPRYPVRPVTLEEEAAQAQLQPQPLAPPYAATPAVSVTGAPVARVAQQGPPAAPIRQTVQLSNLGIDDLHKRLEVLLDRPLPLREGASRNVVQFGIEAVPGARISVAANRNTGAVTLVGSPQLTKSWAEVVTLLDQPAQAGPNVTRLLATDDAVRNEISMVARTLVAQPGRRPITQPMGARKDQLVTMLFQPGPGGGQATIQEQGQPDDGQPLTQDGQPENGQPLIDPQAAIANAAAGLIGPVQIEYVEGLDILVIRGDQRDVARVIQIIEQIEQITEGVPLKIEVLELQQVQSEAIAVLLEEVYEEVFTPRQGTVSITPLVKPNALLIIGREENVDTVINLVKELDKAVPPATQFEVFQLEHAAAFDAKAVLDEFFAERTGLGTQVLVTADFRSNSVIVRASPRDLLEVEALIQKLDTDNIASVSQVRVFELKNGLATEIAPILQDAISAQPQRGTTGGQGFGGQGGGQGFQPQGGQGQGAGAQQQTGIRSQMLELMAIDTEGRRQIESGVLTGVRVNASERSNSLIVTAPSDSMNLIAALIEQLDRPSTAVAQLKVFTIANGDASSLRDMLETLFGATEAGGGGGGGQQQGGFGGIGSGSESSLIQLRLSVDERTNSIIAAGTREDLATVEAILFRLDESDVRDRENRVFRLRNAFAPDVAAALNDLLQQERDVEQLAPGGVSAVELQEREVIIVPEEASNSLIVSATPQLFRDVARIIQEIDERPPMVMIQVLIAEVSLNDTDEFGVELGLQDSVLFDRSLLSDIMTTDTTTTTTTPGGAVTTVQSQQIQSASNLPGFAFGNPQTSLGNSGSSSSLASAGKVAAQGLTNFALGRINSDLGFGGFVFSAGSENVTLLLRALQESRRLEVLSRPQVMALDNQPAVVQVGQRVPTIASSDIAATGAQVNQVTFIEVGLILRVQPRVSPDGLVVMQIEAEKSEVGPEAEGIPVSISPTGDVIRSPRINRIFAGTTVHALSGQTIVLGGLITKSSTDVHRRVPLISEIPLLGDLFRFDSVSESRNELLIIMTPRVVRNYLDAEMIKQVESTRMNWVLSDVVSIYGPAGLRGRDAQWGDTETSAVYPNYVPAEGEVVVPPAEVIENPTPMIMPSPGPIMVPDEPQTLPADQLQGSKPQDASSTETAIYNRDPRQRYQTTPASHRRVVPLPPTR